MKSFLLAAIVAIGLAYAAAAVLDDRFQETTATEFTTAGVRLGDPGENLVQWR
jgi:hypothetical protein